MATTRARSLTEGSVFHSPVAPATFRLSRQMTLRDMARINQYTVTGGVPVLTDTMVNPRQTFEVGALVEVQQPSRTSRVPNPWMDATSTVGFTTKHLAVITAMDPAYPNSIQIKLLAQSAIGIRSYNRACAIERVREVNGVRLWSTHPAVRVVDGEYVHPPVPDSVEVMRRLIQLDDRKRVVHKRHITRIGLDQVDPVFLKTVQTMHRELATRAMYERLAVPYANRHYRDSERTHRLSALRVNRTSNAKRLSTMIQLARTTQTPTAATNLWSEFHNYARADRSAEFLFQRAVRNTPLAGWVRGQCGHWHDAATTVTLTDSYMTPTSYCPECAADALEVLTEDGETVRVHRNTYIYRWSDGTSRIHSEPQIIGGRHSGKGVVGKVEPLKPSVFGQRYLTLGLELEMQAYNGESPEFMARQLKNRLTDANLLDAKAQKKYLHFEHDGSTGEGGFEMVTGYTDLATHATLLKSMFVNSEGKNSFPRTLRSHNARGGSCGIHVHIAKPASLIHNMKIHHFINSNANAELVKDVARRYGDSWCKVSNPQCAPTKTAAVMYKGVKAYRTPGPSAVKQACDRINENDRYQAVNYQNSATVEFRIFRGTTVYGSIMACLEFAQAVHDFTKVTTAVNLDTPSFIAFINKPENRALTRNLRVYLAKRGYKTVVPTVKKDGPTTTRLTAPSADPVVTPVEWTEHNHGPSMADIEEAMRGPVFRHSFGVQVNSPSFVAMVTTA